MKLAVGRAFGRAARPRTDAVHLGPAAEPRGPDSGPRGPSQGAVAEQAHGWTPAIGISLVAIDGKCLGADREPKHPESTGIAVPRPDRPRSAARSATRRRSPMPSGKPSAAGHGPGPGREGLPGQRPSGAVHVASAAKVAMIKWSSRRIAASAMFEGFVRELIRAYGRAMVVRSRWMLARHPIQNLMMLAVSGIPHIAALKGNAGALHRRLSMVMGQGTDAPRRAGGIAETQEVLRPVHRQFGRIDELGDCRRRLPAGLASANDDRQRPESRRDR